VGLGASADELGALEEFFRIPADTGMAFVVVLSHRGGEHNSLRLELLQRCTSMPVLEATEGVRVVPNKVYVPPAGKSLEFHRGLLHLVGIRRRGTTSMPIDHFLRSLAEDRQQNAVGIILSETGADGALGLAAIKGHSGLTLVQDQALARHAGAPRSATAMVKVVDVVLPSDAIRETLVAYSSGPRLSPGALARESGQLLEQIFALVRDRTGHDFSLYKTGTGHSQIERRMRLLRVRGLAEYAHLLHEDPKETDALCGEMLRLGVTGFFRDPLAFDALARKLPRLLQSRRAGSRVRVWVAGCATGEEAYSVAILLREYLAKRRHPLDIRIFATDVDGDAIKTAGAGAYPFGIVDGVAPGRLRRFFLREQGSYRVSPEIRDLIVFARHNLLCDPPFVNLDLVCCRNLLGYMEPAGRRQLVSILARVVKPHGLLLLGASETLGDADVHFKDVDRKARLFRRTTLPSLLPKRLQLESARPTRAEVVIARLAGELITAQETERKRIAADLHDDLGQRLAAIQVDLDLLGQQATETSRPMTAEIKALGTHLAAVSDDLHELARGLHPSVLEHLGLQIALRDLCRDFERRERIAVVFLHRGALETLPKDVTLCLYRVVQEALHNVVKHAAATNATVRLERTAKGVGLCVKDPGKGFDPRATGGASVGIGLLSMEERMRSVMGRLTVWSRPGIGTHIHAWAPTRTQS